MKSLYLILAATAVVVTCEPQRSNNDIIWYPVDDDDGVFISIYGEKRRASANDKWRGHRRARYSGMEPPAPLALSYDPTENRDPSFFHNINDRPLIAVPPVPKVPPSFQREQWGGKRRPKGQGSTPIENFQDIFNEVFDYNKYPPLSEDTGSRPGTSSQWGSQSGMQRPGTSNRPGSTSQWGNQERPGTTDQWGNQSGMQSSGTTNQWGTQSGMQRPGTTSEWISGNRPGMQRPGTTSAALIQQGSTRPNRPSNINTNRPNSRPTSQSDKLIFPDELSISTSSSTTTPSNLIPKDPPTMSPCERLCPVTPQFNPVCGSDGVTYSNAGRLKCANMCGKNVRLSHHGNCGRTTLVTPLVSHTPKQKFNGFWLIDN